VLRKRDWFKVGCSLNHYLPSVNNY
jgi:hypothetical protein